MKTFNVLVLCTHNSARSILGEALFNHLGQGQIHAFSAGSQPSGEVDPLALETLAAHGMSFSGMGIPRSKSWDEFAGPGAPQFDFIFTVCAGAAGEACPVWPGHPGTAHWGIADLTQIESPGRGAGWSRNQAGSDVSYRDAVPIHRGGCGPAARR